MVDSNKEKIRQLSLQDPIVNMAMGMVRDGLDYTQALEIAVIALSAGYNEQKNIIIRMAEQSSLPPSFIMNTGKGIANA